MKRQESIIGISFETCITVNWVDANKSTWGQLNFKAMTISLKDLFNANACWLVLIYDTLIIPYVAKRISKYVSYIL